MLTTLDMMSHAKKKYQGGMVPHPSIADDNKGLVWIDLEWLGFSICIDVSAQWFWKALQS